MSMVTQELILNQAENNINQENTTDVTLLSDSKFPWDKLKQENIKVANLLKLASDTESNQIARNTILTPNQYYNMLNCGNVLKFEVDINNLNNKKLKQAFFCKHRFCPLCNKRKARLLSYQAGRMINKINENEKDISYLFLTLTVRNLPPTCTISELIDLLNQMQKASRMLFFPAYRKGSKFNKYILGAIKSMEIVASTKTGFHPHYHILLAVKNDYFKSKNYVTQNQIAKLWKDCLKVEYAPIVDIRKINVLSHKDITKATKEALKYATKLEFINKLLKDIYKNNLTMINKYQDEIEIVKSLVIALKRRNLVSYSGIFRDYKKILKLEDIEKSNLLNIDNSSNQENISNSVLLTYYFNMDYGVYILE